MKTLTCMLVVNCAVILSACSGSTPNGTTSTNINSGTDQLYIAYSSNIEHMDPRIDTLYKTDGTLAGTSVASTMHIPSNTNSSNFGHALIDSFYFFGDYLYYHLSVNSGIFIDTETVYRLHTPSGVTDTQVIKSLIPIFPLRREEANDKLYYLHHTGALVPQLTTFALDGTYTTQSLSADNVNISSPLALHNDDILLSSIISSTFGAMLEFDSSNANAQLTQTFATFDLFVRQYYPVGTKRYMLASPHGAPNLGIWVYDTQTPTSPPTFVGNFDAGGDEDVITSYIAGNNIYFSARNGGTYDVYKLATTTNTITQLTFDNAPYGFAPTGFVSFNLGLYFVINGELRLLIDPTTTITENVKEGTLAALSNKIYFAATTATGDEELYSYDGTSTVLEYDIFPGPSPSYPKNINEVNGKIVFQATPDGVTNKLFSLDAGVLTPLN